MSRKPVKKKGRLPQMKTIPPKNQATTAYRGGGAPRGGAAKLRNRRVPPLPGRRRGQGVITGLASRRPTALLKRTGPLNRPAVNQKSRQKSRPFNQHAEVQIRKQEVPRRPYKQPDLQRVQNAMPVRRAFQLRRRPMPPIQQTQREARQATFLFRRGLKVQAQLQKPNPRIPPVKTRQWRTPPASSGNGILTISIDNPTARTQPEPPTAWTLHPPAVSPAPPKVEPAEKKIPKGVPLQFDINSVVTPRTSMTLNERFRILKDQRTATAHTSKGSRFVTVG